MLSLRWRGTSIHRLTMPKNDIILFDTHETIDVNENGLIITGEQEIPSEFLDDLAERRHNSLNTREGEFMHVATIPMVIIAKWKREGFDLIGDRNITPAMIAAKLRHEDMGGLLATAKRV